MAGRVGWPAPPAASRLARVACLVAVVVFVGLASACLPADVRGEGLLVVRLQYLPADWDTLDVRLEAGQERNVFSLTAEELESVDGLPAFRVPNVSVKLDTIAVEALRDGLLARHGRICQPSYNVANLIRRETTNVHTITLIDADRYELNTEVCDVADNDCNGVVDESCLECDQDGCWAP